GVQTCALPIYGRLVTVAGDEGSGGPVGGGACRQVPLAVSIGRDQERPAERGVVRLAALVEAESEGAEGVDTENEHVPGRGGGVRPRPVDVQVGELDGGHRVLLAGVVAGQVCPAGGVWAGQSASRPSSHASNSGLPIFRCSAASSPSEYSTARSRCSTTSLRYSRSRTSSSASISSVGSRAWIRARASMGLLTGRAGLCSRPGGV